MNATHKRARGDLARRPILVGDHIEVPGNTDCLRAAAEMFDWEFGNTHSSDLRLLARDGLSIVAIENTPSADNLFHYRPPDGPFAVVVGNERKGISRQVLRLADRVVQIPVASVHVNTLNVAAAAAVALYCLSRAREGRIGGSSGRRPDVLLAGGADAIELGSAVRSAACFGWTHLFVDDRHATWFETDRVTRSLGRGAARRGKNPIRVIPAPDDAAFDEVCAITARGDGEPLRRTHLALGAGQLVVIADDHSGLDDHRLARLGRRVRRVSLDIEHGERRPFRLVAAIALAEIARQIGGFRAPARST